jgi:hypothetical protein
MTLAGSMLGISAALAHPLDRDLINAGLPILPDDKAEAHKRNLLRMSRKGVWQTWWPVARLTFRTLVWSFLIAAAALCVGAVAVMVQVVSEIAPIAPEFALFASMAVSTAQTAFIVSGEIFVLAFIAVLTLDRFPGFTMAGEARWCLVPIARYSRGVIPDHVRARISAAEQIPGTKVYVEYFEDDPFIVVKRGFAKRRVAAWATGTDLDRM